MLSARTSGRGLRWIGAAAVAAVLATAAPGAAQADFDRAVCEDLQGQITAITAVGPGVVTVDGWAGPGPADSPTCDPRAVLYGYAGNGNESPEYWHKMVVKGMAGVEPQAEGQFATGLGLAEGNSGVCLEDTKGRPLDCYEVRVPRHDGEGHGWTGTPVVVGRISVHLGQGQPVPPPPPEGPFPPPCGHCM